MDEPCFARLDETQKPAQTVIVSDSTTRVRGAGGLVSRESAQRAVDCLEAIISADKLRGAAFRLSSIRLLLDQYRWEQEQARKSGENELDSLTDAELEEIARMQERAMAK